MVNLWVLINRAVDLVMAPFSGMHPMWPLTIWSVIMGVTAMIIYKYTSNQDGIIDAKEKIKGHFFEVWLYIDDAAVIAKAQVNILWNALRYLGYAMPPLVIMIVLFFPLFSNFETRYAMRPVRQGEDVLVKVKLSEKWNGWEDKVRLELPDGIKMVGHPVRFTRTIKKSPKSVVILRKEHEVNYKLRPDSEGRLELRLTGKGASFIVPIATGDNYGERAPFYATTSLGLSLLFPPLVSIPEDAGIETVEIKYPEASFPFLGWNTWWVWPFLIISMIAAFAVKGVFKVEI